MTPRLVLFDLDGTLVDHEAASAAAVTAWLAASGWGAPGDVHEHVAAWQDVAERHFPAYRARQVSFLEQRRLRLRDFLPRFGVDASAWSDARLDEVFGGYLSAYEQAWCAYSDAAACLTAVGAVAQVGVLSNGDRLDVDAEGSAATGLRGIWVDRAGREVPTPLDRIGSLEELPALLGVTSRPIA